MEVLIEKLFDVLRRVVVERHVQYQAPREYPNVPIERNEILRSFAAINFTFYDDSHTHTHPVTG